MNSINDIADSLEIILANVVSEAPESSPTPKEYFLLFDKTKSDSWILGFLFDSSEDLRIALEDGVCYWIHTFTSNLLASSDLLGDIERFIVFDFGELSDEVEDQQSMYNKHYAALLSLHEDRADSVFITCNLCGHNADDHQMRGSNEEGKEYPTHGWMICPDQNCFCFRTWSLGDA